MEHVTSLKPDVTDRTPDPVDVMIGAKIRARRKILGMSQEGLAEAIDLTFQQVQKYERGSNRVSGSKLWAIAKALSCNVQSLFPDDDEVEGLAEAGDVAEIVGVTGYAYAIDRACPDMLALLCKLDQGQLRKLLAVASEFEPRRPALKAVA